MLTPPLQPGQVVVMDNLSAHKSERVKRAHRGAGCKLLYLSPYNPLEEAFSKVKSILARTNARTRTALIEAMGVAILAVTAGDA
jgi:transposase